MTEALYTEEEVMSLVSEAVADVTGNLENRIRAMKGISGESDMQKRIKQRVKINGEEHWITGENQQVLMENYLKLCIKQGVVNAPAEAVSEKRCPLFGEYLMLFVENFKRNQASLTVNTRKTVIKNHILPRLGSYPLDQITTADLQQWFNELAITYSHETILKIKNTISPALDAAVEDGYIQRNPAKSGRIYIGGKETTHHKAIPKELICKARESVDNLGSRERTMFVLLATTGMRFEEVLGLKWEDIDRENGWAYINRAVVHPKRNQPEVKAPKTKTSTRKIPLSVWCMDHLEIKERGFVLSSAKHEERPMSFTEARNCFTRMRDALELQGYSAHDFRDTCATEWRENGMPIDVVARLLGHSKSDVTESRYVKYREDVLNQAREVM